MVTRWASDSPSAAATSAGVSNRATPAAPGSPTAVTRRLPSLAQDAVDPLRLLGVPILREVCRNGTLPPVTEGERDRVRLAALRELLRIVAEPGEHAIGESEHRIAQLLLDGMHERGIAAALQMPVPAVRDTLVRLAR